MDVLEKTGAELDGAIQRERFDSAVSAVKSIKELPEDRAIAALVAWERQAYETGKVETFMPTLHQGQRIGAHNCSCYLRNELQSTFETIKSDLAEIHRAQVLEADPDAPCPEGYAMRIVEKYLPAVVAGIEKIKAEIEAGIGDPQEL